MLGHDQILVVDADEESGHAIVAQLVADEYPSKHALTATHATVLAGHHPPALVVLGGLETPDGALALLRGIRAGEASWHSDVPVIMLSPSAQEPDLLRAFEAGTDDFMHCPPSYLELRARLRAILRRTKGINDGRVVRVGPLTIDTAAYTTTLHDQPVALRRLEYELLVHLAADPTRVFGKHELMRDVWHLQMPITTRTLDSHASRLRSKLRVSGERWIINARGIGYRLR
jgi:DNA-binding response OmpR family regulator